MYFKNSTFFLVFLDHTFERLLLKERVGIEIINGSSQIFVTK